MSIRSRWWGPRLGGCNPDGLDSTSGSHTIAVMAKKPIQKKPDPMFIWEISRHAGPRTRDRGGTRRSGESDPSRDRTIPDHQSGAAGTAVRGR